MKAFLGATIFFFSIVLIFLTIVDYSKTLLEEKETKTLLMTHFTIREWRIKVKTLFKKALKENPKTACEKIKEIAKETNSKLWYGFLRKNYEVDEITQKILNNPKCEAFISIVKRKLVVKFNSSYSKNYFIPSKACGFVFEKNFSKATAIEVIPCE